MGMMISQFATTWTAKLGRETFCTNLDKRLSQKKMRKNKPRKLNPLAPMKVKSFKDAVLALEDTLNFIESRGHSTASLTHIGSAVDAVASCTYQAAEPV